REFSEFFQKGCVAAAASVWIAHALIPTPPPPRPAGPTKPAGLPPVWAARVAFCDTLIMAPLIALFMLEANTSNTVYLTTGLIVPGVAGAVPGRPGLRLGHPHALPPRGRKGARLEGLERLAGAHAVGPRRAHEAAEQGVARGRVAHAEGGVQDLRELGAEDLL